MNVRIAQQGLFTKNWQVSRRFRWMRAGEVVDEKKKGRKYLLVPSEFCNVHF